MPQPGTYGMPELFWDQGWALRYNNCWFWSLAQSPTASANAIWLCQNQASETTVEEIVVSSNTTMVVTVGYIGAQSGMTGYTAPTRIPGVGATTASCKAGVTTIGGSAVTFFTAQITGGVDARLLQGQWFGLTNANWFGLWTPTVAANVTATFFGRCF